MTKTPHRRPPTTAAPLRRDFLRLGLGGAALLVGCGDDGSAGDATATSSTGDASSSSTSSASTSAAESTGPTGTAADPTGDPTTSTTSSTTSSSSSGSTSDATTTDGTTGGVDECDDGGQAIDFDPDLIPLDELAFPTAIMAGEMKPTSAMIACVIADAAPKTLRIWRPGDAPGQALLVHESLVAPTADGFSKTAVDGLCPGTWYRYALFAGEPGAFTGRSILGEFRTAIADDALEPLTFALAACNGDSFDWPSMSVTADEYYDAFLHLGDMAYNDGAATLPEFRASWRKYLGAEGYKLAFARAGLYATWDDHEIDDNSNFDRETMDPAELERRQNAMDSYFEVVPIDAQGPKYRLWRSFRWGLTAEIIVLDCRYERRPSLGRYISPEQMAFLQERLLESPCHFKVVMNSVPITNMPLPWDVAANDRWEGYPNQRDQLLAFIDEHDIKNVWFVSGDFHVCFVSRLEPSGSALSARTREIAVTSGNENPIPEFLTLLDPPQFAYGVHKARGALITLDPEADAVHVRFIDPESGVDDYSASLTQA